jgi:hypothetical protein
MGQEMNEVIIFINTIRDTLWKTINRFSDEQLNEKIETGQWSIMQVLDHLYLIEKSVTKGMKDKLENGEQLSQTDKPIHFTIDRSTKVDAPPYLIPTNDFIPLNVMKEKLNGSRNDLLHLIRQTSMEVLSGKGFKHPLFGMLSLDQWVEFIGYHEKRHHTQIEELIAQKQQKENSALS